MIKSVSEPSHIGSETLQASTHDLQDQSTTQSSDDCLELTLAPNHEVLKQTSWEGMHGSKDTLPTCPNQGKLNTNPNNQDTTPKVQTD